MATKRYKIKHVVLSADVQAALEKFTSNKGFRSRNRAIHYLINKYFVSKIVDSSKEV